MCLSQSVVVPLADSPRGRARPGSPVRASALTADHLGQVQQVPGLQRFQQVGVESLAAVVDLHVWRTAPAARECSSTACCIPSAVRKTPTCCIITFCICSRSSAARAPPLRLARSCSSRSSSAWRVRAGSGSESCSPGSSAAMCRPARRPKTRMSLSELVPSRLAPCTD